MNNAIYAIIFLIGGVGIVFGLIIWGINVIKANNHEDRADEIGKITGNTARDINLLRKAHNASLHKKKQFIKIKKSI